MSVVKRNGTYCICISICFFLSLLSVFIEPVDAGNYTIMIDSARPYITIVDISETDKSPSNSNQIDDGQGKTQITASQSASPNISETNESPSNSNQIYNSQDETQITTSQSALDKLIAAYIWFITVVSALALLSLVLLIINMLKIQYIQLSLLKLDKDFSFKESFV